MRDPRPVLWLCIAHLLAVLALLGWWLGLPAPERLARLRAVQQQEQAATPPPDTLVAQASWLFTHRRARLHGLTGLLGVAGIIGLVEGTVRRHGDPLGGMRFACWTLGVLLSALAWAPVGPCWCCPGRCRPWPWLWVWPGSWAVPCMRWPLDGHCCARRRGRNGEMGIPRAREERRHMRLGLALLLLVSLGLRPVLPRADLFDQARGVVRTDLGQADSAGVLLRGGAGLDTGLTPQTTTLARGSAQVGGMCGSFDFVQSLQSAFRGTPRHL